MFFLLRVTFWLSIVVLLLPTGKTNAPGAPEVGAADAFSAASAAISDMRQFCTRQPEACNVGSQAAAAFGQKAQAGAKMIYDYFAERAGAEENGPAVRPADAVPHRSGQPSQNTLTASDRSPGWRGQAAPRSEQHARGPL